jgi:hypothetical protein
MAIPICPQPPVMRIEAPSGVMMAVGTLYYWIGSEEDSLTIENSSYDGLMSWLLKQRVCEPGVLSETLTISRGVSQLNSRLLIALDTRIWHSIFQ